MNKSIKHVAVLMGGWSAEREVSLVTGAACVKALQEAGYDVTPIDVQRDMGALMTRLYPKPDVVFNALHGRFGEDGCVQGLLDILAIPYTYSGLLASAIAMNKPMAKTLFEKAGLKVAEHIVTTLPELVEHDVMEPPFVIKPVNEGSSVGVHIVMDDDHRAVLDDGSLAGEIIMVEKFIEGRELTVAVMGDKALAVTEITTERGFYDYDAKYVEGGSKHIVPAKISKKIYAKAMEQAVIAHNALGCRGISRADFRLDGNDLYILEINTQPGMTPTSLVPEQALHAGMSFKQLVCWMVDNAEYDQ